MRNGVNVNRSTFPSHTSSSGSNYAGFCIAMLIVDEDGPWLISNSPGGDTFTPDPPGSDPTITWNYSHNEPYTWHRG